MNCIDGIFFKSKSWGRFHIISKLSLSRFSNVIFQYQFETYFFISFSINWIDVIRWFGISCSLNLLKITNVHGIQMNRLMSIIESGKS